jgi:ABC-type branched-subunit amino acid transport system substrate-binding protein
MTATDQGVTPKDITVGVVTVDLGALGDLIDLPSTEELQRAYNAAIADVNAKGGVRCRMLKARYYVDSGLDQSQQHAACLQMKEDKVFTVFNNLFSPSESTCVAKQKIPNIWYTAPHTPDVRQYQPYILSWQPDYDQLIRHYVQGAKAEGFFKNMKKLGILERTCYPDEMTALSREMRAAGLDLSKASRFSYGCPEVQPTPEQHTAGVLQFKREGVTHILNIAYADDGEFSRYADQQDYKPAFSHMEDASATAIQTGTQKPGDSFNGTLLISSIETGARETPGYKYNAATQECARIMRKAGLPAPQDQAVAIHFGIACVNVAMFKKMAEAAPSLVRTQLATGLVKSGPLTLSYPAGPVHPTDVGRPTGGQGWRPGKWFTSCQCWRVTNVHYRTDY